MGRPGLVTVAVTGGLTIFGLDSTVNKKCTKLLQYWNVVLFTLNWFIYHFIASAAFQVKHNITIWAGDLEVVNVISLLQAWASHSHSINLTLWTHHTNPYEPWFVFSSKRTASVDSFSSIKCTRYIKIKFSIYCKVIKISKLLHKRANLVLTFACEYYQYETCYCCNSSHFDRRYQSDQLVTLFSQLELLWLNSKTSSTFIGWFSINFLFIIKGNKNHLLFFFPCYSIHAGSVF